MNQLAKNARDFIYAGTGLVAVSLAGYYALGGIALLFGQTGVCQVPDSMKWGAIFLPCAIVCGLLHVFFYMKKHDHMD